MYTRFTNPFDYFDRIYFINLEKRIDRRSQAENELSIMGINDAYRIVGVDHENPVIGCRFSHSLIFEDALKCGFDRILVFEDDVEFFPNAFENMSLALRELPTEWDMFYLGANLDVFKAYQVKEHIARLTGAFTTHAYAVRRPLFRVLYNLNADNLETPNDVEYSKAIHPNYQCYLSIPLIAGQRDSYSDIMKKRMSSNKVFQDRLQSNLVRR